MVDLKNEEGSCDVKIWEWLLQLIQYLGADGMSSEESGVEVNDEGIAQKVYRVKIMPWRRNINQELAIIDKARLQDKDLYSEAGAKPVPRKSSEQNEASSSQPVCDLPSPFMMICGLIASTPISVTAHCEYPKNNSIGLSMLQPKANECGNVVDTM